jgi:hypothetical protein
MQQLYLGIFVAAMIALVVCGCILTRRKPKKPLPSVLTAVPYERQPGCFALEEESGGHWSGSGVPVIKEVRPTL